MIFQYAPVTRITIRVMLIHDDSAVLLQTLIKKVQQLSCQQGAILNQVQSFDPVRAPDADLQNSPGSLPFFLYITLAPDKLLHQVQHTRRIRFIPCH